MVDDSSGAGATAGWWIAGAVFLIAVAGLSIWPLAPASADPVPPRATGQDASAMPPAGDATARLPLPAPTAPRENPGLINEIGKLFSHPPLLFPALKTPQQAIDDFNTNAKDASDGLARIAAPSSMVTGRAKCPAAANGAPDCKAASEALCKANGFARGKSVDTDAVQVCSPLALLSGRKLEPGDCRTDSFVTRVLCR